MRITKKRDKHFQGFRCDKCGRELKHAFSVYGSGTYGKECVYVVSGISIKSANIQIKKQVTISKIWGKMLSLPSVYNLDSWVRIYGNLDKVEDVFFKYGKLQ